MVHVPLTDPVQQMIQEIRVLVKRQTEPSREISVHWFHGSTMANGWYHELLECRQRLESCMA